MLNPKIELLAKRGYDPRHHSAGFWLEVAVKLEADCKAMGPFDPAFEHYAQQARDAFEAALLSEQLKESQS